MSNMKLSERLQESWRCGERCVTWADGSDDVVCEPYILDAIRALETQLAESAALIAKQSTAIYKLRHDDGPIVESNEATSILDGNETSASVPASRQNVTVKIGDRVRHNDPDERSHGWFGTVIRTYGNYADVQFDNSDVVGCYAADLTVLPPESKTSPASADMSATAYETVTREVVLWRNEKTGEYTAGDWVNCLIPEDDVARATVTFKVPRSAPLSLAERLAKCWSSDNSPDELIAEVAALEAQVSPHIADCDVKKNSEKEHA